MNNDMLVVTTNDVPGHDIIEVYGEVFGLIVRSRNVFSNLGASLRTIVGGEVRGYTKLLADTRAQAMDRLCEEARSRGANAIVMMRFDSGDLGQQMNEVVAYGTAVRIQPSRPGHAPARHHSM
jgi:uncharacterized protein YbjQ (UPF0145 family)